jgi:ABC-type multidrug transport system fused ATPase/permease subunit
MGGPGGGLGGEPGRGTFGAGAERGERRVSDRSLLKRFMKYIKPYRKQIIVIIVAVITAGLCDTFTPYLHAIVINQIIGSGNLGGFLWWIPLFTFVATLSFAMQYLQQYLLSVVGENIISEFREDMMERLQILSLRYFAEGETAE